MKTENKKKKICFIQTNSYYLFNKKISPSGSQGGAEVQLYFWARELAKDKKFDVSFVVGDFGQHEVETIEGVKVYRAVTPKGENRFLKKLFQTVMFWKIFKSINANIYITSTKNNIVSLVSFFCKNNNKKHVHRTAHEEEVGLVDSKETWVNKIFLESLKNASKIIVQNRSHQDSLRKKYGIDSVVVRNSFNVERERDVENGNKKFIFWVGRMTREKRPEIFLKLAQKFPKEDFLMVYNMNKNKKAEWQKIQEKVDKIQNLKLIEKILFVDIQDYFNRAKVFVNTSDTEGFPNTFIQAGIGKTPILSLNVNPDDFITRYNAGSFAGGDFENMKEQLNVLLGNEEARLKKGENIFSYVRENHDLEKNVTRLKNLLNEMIDN